MKLVGARPGHDGQHPAGCQAVFRLVGGLRHPELANRVHREVLARLAHLRPGVVHAVDDEAIRVLACAGADVDVAAIEEPADVVLRHAGREHREVDPASRRDRQVLNLLVRHRGRHGRRRRIDQRRVAGHGDRFGEGGRLEREVEDDRLIDDQREVLPCFSGEPLQFCRDGVAAGRQHRQAELPAASLIAVRVRPVSSLRAVTRRAREHAAARVFERAGDLGVLGERGLAATQPAPAPSNHRIAYRATGRTLSACFSLRVPSVRARRARDHRVPLVLAVGAPGRTGRTRSSVREVLSRCPSSSIRSMCNGHRAGTSRAPSGTRSRAWSRGRATLLARFHPATRSCPT